MALHLPAQLVEVLRERALSEGDEANLDGVGRSVAGRPRPRDEAWGWRVELTSVSLSVWAHTTNVLEQREAAAAEAVALFDELAGMVDGEPRGSVGADTILDRVNNEVVGWVGSVYLRVVLPRERRG